MSATGTDGQLEIECEDDPSLTRRPDSLGLLATASKSPTRSMLKDVSTASAEPSPSTSMFSWTDWVPIYPRLLPTQFSRPERQYLAHFSSHVLGILPENLSPIHPYIHSAEIVLYAAMATGAANLARLHGEYVPTTPKSASSVAWVPEPSHKINAFFFAGKALSLATRYDKPNPAIVVSAQILLSLVEAELGTFEGLRSHLDCLQGFICQTRKSLLGLQVNQELVEAVMQHQLLQSNRLFRSWDSRVFSQSCRQLGAIPKPGSSLFFQALGWAARALGSRLGLLETMRHSKVCSHPLRESHIRQLLFLLAPDEPQLREMRPEDILQQMKQTRLELDRLSDIFRRCQVPAELLYSTGCSLPATSWSETGLSVPQFATHEKAMDSADFIFCKIMCDKDFMASMALPSGSPDMPDNTHIHAWIVMLLQIVSGIDTTACATRNVYRPGILQMLFACLYPCRGNTQVLDFLEAFYKRDSAQVYGRENVSFPSTVTIPVLKILRSQWGMGRTVLIMQSLDGRAKPSSPINKVGEWTSCSVHGLEANGDFFDEVFRDLSDGEMYSQHG
jgi:hypothetical protein